MSTREFLERLQRKKIKLWADGGALRYKSFRGAIEPEDLEELRRHKGEILELMRQAASQRQTGHAIEPAPRDPAPPLSFAQRRLWFLDQMGAGTAYNLSLAVALEGELDTDALTAAISAVVARHEVLRTRLPSVDGKPLQDILPPSPLPLRRIDLSDREEAERRSALRRVHEEEAVRPFELATEIPIRPMLVRLGTREHVLILSIHHIAFDGWSFGVLNRELLECYSAITRGHEPQLPDLPVQYADYAYWQRRRLQGDTLQRQLDYWREKLGGATPTELPTDRRRPAMQTFAGASYPFALTPDLTAALRRLSRSEGATLTMTLLAGFKILLSRYTGKEDIVVGSPIANRNHHDIENLIGFFLNSVALRTDLSGDPTFVELLRRVRETSLGSYEHQDVPFEFLVDELEVMRDLSRSPIFQVTFTMQNAPAEPFQLPGLQIRPVSGDKKSVRFDLELEVVEHAGRIVGSFNYNTDLFDHSTIERCAAHLVTLLESAAADPERPISRLSMLGEDERRALLAGSRPAGAEPDVEAREPWCIHERFEAQAARTPDATAVVFGDRHLSYRDLNEQANRIAHRLRAIGAGPDVLVGLAAERGLQLVVGVLGILKAGAAYVPLDPTYPEQRLAFMIDDARMLLILAQPHLLDALPRGSARVVPLDPEDPTVAGEPTTNPDRVATPKDLAYVIYTSGSTGRPKGVLVEHRQVARLFTSTERWFGFDERDVWTLFHSCAFDFSVWELWGALLYGGRLVVVPYEMSRTPEEFHKLVKREGVTVLNQTPSAFRQFMRADEGSDQHELSLRLVIFGGEALELRSLRPWFDRHADRAPELVNMYGITETTVHVTCRPIRRRDVDEAPGSVIGKPISDLRVHILDAHGEPVPTGVPGEMYVGGSGVTRGYLARPELTATRFVPDPFDPEGHRRLYRTGDVARVLGNGDIVYLGRNDEQVKIRGFRIELGEIEAALTRHDRVREAVAVVREDDPGTKRIVAYVVADDDADGLVSELRAFLVEQLPQYMVPAAFVLIESVPLTVHGKVDRRALPAPMGDRASLGDAYVAPRTPEEIALAAIWSDLLRVERVGVHDNFFELGGDSIQSIQIIARAREAGLHLMPRQMFQHQTVAELAAVVETAGDATIAAEQGPVVGEVPLTPIQRWFFEPKRLDPQHYNQALLFTVGERLDPAVVERAVGALLTHHDALRSRLTRSASGWRQVIVEPGGVLPFECVDLSALGEAEQTAAITARADALQASFVLDEGPIVRVAQFDLGADRPGRLLLVIHHLAVDGVSWRILREDLQLACEQLARGEAVTLRPKTTSYRQWAVRLAAHAQSDDMQAELETWLEQPWDDVGELPPEGPVERNTVGRARHCVVQLSEMETRALLQDVPRAYNTQIDDVLVTALAQAVAPWTGQPRLLIDMEGHGREDLFDDVDLSRTVGWFTSIYPVIVDVGGPEGQLLPVESALKSVKEQLRAVPNRGVGYAVLRYLRDDTSVRSRLAALAQAQVSFNYLGQLDQLVDERSMFDLARESAGPLQSPRDLRSHLLEVNGAVVNRRLQISLIYGSEVHDAETIEAVAERYRAALVALIEHCTASGTGGCTPSDFPLARVDQPTLDRLVAKHGADAIEDLYPLTPMQQGMLFHSAHEPATGVYIEQLRFLVEGLDTEIFRRAWETIVDRHAVLRMSVVGVSSERPLQLVHRRCKLPFVEHDCRDLAAEEQERWLARFLREDCERGVDLDAPPPMRIALVRLDDDRYQLIWTFHHIALDGWSFPRVLNEVVTVYEAQRRREAPALPRVRSFRDYVAWLERQDERETEGYWRRTLESFATAPTILEGRSVRATEDYDVVDRMLTPALTESLRAFASQGQVTLNTLVAGAWSLLLSRYSGEPDVVFGTIVSGRPADLEGVESMVGMFVNTLPLRVRVDADQRLATWLQDLQASQAELRQYEHSPLWEVQRHADLPAGTPLFETLYVFENYPVDMSAIRASDVTFRMLATEERTGYPLALTVGVSDRVGMRLTYDCDRFDAVSMERLVGHLQMMLESFASDPAQRLGDVTMLSAAEARQVIVEWNDTARPYPRDESVHRLFEQQVAQTPDAVAVEFEGQQLTYGELDTRANRLGRHLAGQGVTPTDLVAIFMERSVDFVVGVLSILKCGAAYVPLDTVYPASRLAVMLADATPKVVLTHELLLTRLPDHDTRTICLDRDETEIASADDGVLDWDGTGNDPAYVIYTSGSTGQPKGVCVPHCAISRLVLETDYVSLGPSDRIAQVSNVSFDAATFEIWGALLNGGQLVGITRDVALAPARFAQALRDSGVSVLFITTALFNQLAEIDGIFSSLRCVLFGGEAVDPDRVRAVLAHGAPERLLHVYGPTENTTFSTWFLVEKVPDDSTTVPIGRPIANSTMYVLDADLEPVPIGVPGELYLGDDGLAIGYLSCPDLTAERFVPHRFAAGERLYRTGDLVRYRPDGAIEFIGRNDHQVKLRGFRVELGEIEAALVQQTSVRDAVVLCREDTPGDKRLIAYVTGEDGAAPSPGALRRDLGERLPDYMIPSTFVALDELPLTTNGKVDRKALPAPATERQVDDDYVAPRGEREKQIAAIWREVLELDTVGVHDNFFDLGGHSLRLLRVHVKLREELGYDISITELFQHPTVASLGERLGGGEPAVRTGLDRVQARAGRHRVDGSAIAVVGMIGRFPKAPDLETFWVNLCEGVEGTRFFTDEELRAAGVPRRLLDHPNYVKAASILDDVELFDASFFGYSPREAALLDPQQRVFLECAWAALERAGYDPERYRGLIGVYAGLSVNTYLHVIRSRPDVMATAGGLELTVTNGNEFLPTRVSYKLNLHGPSVNVQTACSTSLVAVHEACRSLLDHQCDMALAGGVSIGVPLIKGYQHEPGSIFSPDGHCRTFDAQARGTLHGHGVGIVVLKRLEEAKRDGDQIHAVLIGTAINNDGSNKIGYTAPSIDGQAEVIALAHTASGVDVETVTYVEAHGTATPLGDPIEIAALTKAFRERTDKQGFCAIGSLKTNLGHLDAAAGVAGLIKTVLALKYGEIPPSLHFESPNPEIDFANSPFFVNTARRAWVPADGVPRRAGISSFGLGGTNAHAIVEEAPTLAPSSPCDRQQLLVLSAKTETARETATANLAEYLREHPAANLADVAYTLQLGRRQFEYRRAVTCGTVEQAVHALEGNVPGAVQTGRAPRTARPVVFLFPGQGVQYVGMGRGLYEAEPAFRDAMDRCLAYLSREMSLDLHGPLYPNGEVDEAATARLTSTAMAQPALFALEYALAETWRARGVEPVACIGHSIGEFTAACISGVLEPEDALRLVAIRGRLMAGMAPGAMTAVPLPEERLRERLDGAGDLWLSTVNGPSLCVVSGPHDRVEALEIQLAADGVACRRLHTSHAFHSGMMDDAVAPFVQAVRGTPIAAPSIPYMSNVTGDWITETDVRDPAYWGRQIREAVRFSPAMARMLEDPDRVLLEVGPGRVLGSLARQQPACGAERVVVPSLRGPGEAGDDNEVLLGALGRLWTGGVDIDWSRLHSVARRRRVVLPTYPFERERFWIDPPVASRPAAAQAAARRDDLADWFYAPTWRRTMMPAAGDPTEPRLVLADGSPFAVRVIERLEAAGCPVVVATSGTAFERTGDRYTVDPGSREDYRRLLVDLVQSDRAPRGIVHLLGVAPVRDRGDDAAVRMCVDRCFHGPIVLAQAIDDAGVTGPIRLDFVTAGVHDVQAEDEICPEKATILGPVRVIGREFPDIACRHIDVAAHAIDGDADALADRVAQELLSSTADAVVAHRGDRRFVESLVPTRVEAVETEQPTRLRSGATYLITGGLGGIGLELARYLVRAVKANLVLTSRTPLPERATWSGYLETHGDDDPLSARIRAVEALERLGAQVMVAEADVADLGRMQAVVDEAASRLGPVRGVIHAAGVAGEGVILLKEREQADRVLAPKLWGTRVLERVCEGGDLDFVVLCSSLASAGGIAGQVDYCAANAVLDAFAHHLSKRTGTFTVAIGWNRWREVGMAVDAARAAGHTGELEGSSNREGVELFRRILAWWNEPHVVIAERDPLEILAPKERAPAEAADALATETSETPARQVGHGRPNLPTTYVAPCTVAEQTLARIWGDLLGIESIGVHDNFFDLGGHSLLATQVMARVRESMRVEAPIKAIFDAPTVAELAEAIGAPDESLVETPVETEPAPFGAVAPASGTRAAATITRRPRDGHPPMSFHQQRLWILDQIEPGAAIYNNTMSCVLRGALDEHALLEALHEIARRHESMRTRFARRDGAPVQIIHDDATIDVVRVDLSELDGTERRAALERRVGVLSTTPFDLEQGPLVRVGLFRLAENETALTLVMHHIVTDAWSLGIIHRELGALYDAFRSGRPSPLAPLPIQYADFAGWHRQWLQGDVLDGLVRYWRETLDGAPPATALPTDRPRPLLPSYRGGLRRFELSPAASAAVNELAARSSASPFMVLLALFNVLLARWSGDTDIVVGTPVAGRQHKELEDLVGFFINTLALRTDLEGASSFRDVLQRVRAGSLDAFAHQELPFELLVEELQPERQLSTSPLFQVMFMLQNTPAESFALADLEVRPLTIPYELSKFDMTMTMIEGRDRWAGYVEYATDLFDASTIDRMIAAFGRLAEALLADPDRAVASVPLVDDAERERLIADWNGTAQPMTDVCVHECVAEQAARTPDAIAIVAGDEPVTYRELDERANQLANHLQTMGAEDETRVAICMDRGPELVVAILGVLKAGGAYVPIDPRHPAERQRLMLADAGAPIVLTQQRSVEAFVDAEVEVVPVDAAWSVIAKSSADAPSPYSVPTNLAYVIYTSGSTGRPKGVCVTHGGLSNYLAWSTDAYGLVPGCVSLVHSSITFDLTVTSLLGPLVAGGTVHLLPDAPGVEALAAAARGVPRVDLLKITPAHVELLSRELSADERAGIGTLVIGGEDLTAKHVALWEGPGVGSTLVNEYGPTETVVGVSTYRVPRGAPRSGSVPIGRPIANTRLYVLDRDLEPVPVGVRGELYIGGAGVARGYLDRPGLTAERFVPDPFGGAPGARLYRTGDLARHRDDGELEFLGRDDEQVKVRGHRIELGEITAVTAGHPNIQQAVVIRREDRPGDVRLVAYVVAEAGKTIEAVALRDSLRERLPEPMIPSAIVVLDAMPLARSGKVDRKALPAPSAQRQVADAFVAPRGELEGRITAVWRDVLGLEQVGVRDNFFDLGGHSLKLLQVHERLTETLGGALTVMDLFQHPTVEALAKHLSGTEGQRSLQRHAQARVRRRGSTDEAAIAVVGMAGRFPEAPDVETFWSNLRNGVEAIRFFTDEALRESGVDEATLRDPNYVKARAVLDGADQFDPWFFGYNPREAELIDPQQRIFLECAWEALERAGYDPERYDGMIGVYAGASMNTYLANVQSHPELLAAAGGLQLVINSDKDFLPTRVSYKLNLRGPSVNVQTACSTSLVAIHEACQSLLEHRCDMAMAGGVSVTVPSVSGYMHQEGGIASPDGHCRAFDANAAGTLGGSGVGIVVLKRLDEALRDGDRIHAVVRGTATNNDGGNKVGYTAPSIEGQGEVIAMAQAYAGVDPDTITYIEAHGTGTALGDPIEVAALTRVFRERTDRKGFCALGSIKTNMGHMDAAAGVAGFMKTVLALEHGEIPPSLHFESPNPEIDFDNSPFFVNTARRAWEAKHTPRRAGVSSFGIGGTNAHVVLEEAPILERSTPGRPWQMLPLSTKSETALPRAAANLAAHLREHEDENLADTAFTLQVGRHEFEQRRAVVCRTAAEAAAALEGSAPNAVVIGRATTSARGVVFMFPGQGAQYTNMALGLYRDELAFRDAVDRCIRWLEAEMGLDLRAVLYPPDGPSEAAAERLKRTSIAQPALFVVEYALAQLWRSWGVEPVACIGHSIGEFTAACIAGVLTLEDALRLVTIRGWLMEEMPPGVMSAVPLPADRVRERLNAEPDLWLAAVNGPWLSVVSGAEEAVAALESKLAAEGVDCRRLHTSHAFHSGLMEGAVAPFVEAVERVSIGTPAIPYVSNVTGDWITEADVRDPQYWGRHIRQAVRFSEGIGRLLADPDHVLLEVGPGRVLGSLARQQPECGPNRVVVPTLRPPKTDAPDAAFAMEALARLWTQGVGIDWSRFHEGERRRRVVLPTYPFERDRYWVEPNRRRAATGRAALDDWFYVPAWRRVGAALPATPEDARVPCLVVTDGADASARVITGLEHAGRDVAVLDGKTPVERGAYRAILAELAGAGRTPREVVHLCGLGVDGQGDAIDETIERCVHAPVVLMQAFDDAGLGAPPRVHLITSGAHEVAAGDEVVPARATVLGPCRVIGCEMPDTVCRHVDLAPAELDANTTIAMLVRELTSGADEPVVALRAGRRYVESFARVPVAAREEDAPDLLRAGGTYLITGGLGGIGLELAKDLMRSVGANLVLTTRSGLPAREAWEGHVAAHGEDDRTSQRIRAVEALERDGGQVLVAAVDVADLDGMRSVVAEATARFGPIHGVVHAAGLPGDGVILRKERAVADAVLAPKVHGTVVLEKLFAASELDFLVLCSSLTSVKADPGQVDYCAANAFLDAFAHRLAATTGTFTVAIDWNRWSEVGMAVDAARAVGHRGRLDGATSAEGVEAFRRILAGRLEPQVVISHRDLWHELSRSSVPADDATGRDGTAEPASAAHPRPSLPTEYVAPSSSAEVAIAAIWQQMLGVEPIGVHDNFFDLGGHSLLATQVLSRMRNAFDLPLAIAELFDAPTVNAMAARIEATVLGEMTQGDSNGKRRG